MVVRPNTIVPRYRSMSPANSAGLNPLRITIVIPAHKAGVATMNNPPE